MSIESALRFEALEYASGLPPSAANISRAAAKFGTEAASWAFTQWQLRKSASKKFSRAAAMLFTRAGLEQSTHEVIASYRASRFPSGETIGDLCCGIGGDLLSLGKRGPAVAYAIDEETAFCARHNVRVYDAQAMVKVGDVLMEPWDFDYAVSDPSRRSQRGITHADT